MCSVDAVLGEKGRQIDVVIDSTRKIFEKCSVRAQTEWFYHLCSLSPQ